MVLETERLVLRRFNKDDWQDLYEYLSDEAVVRYEPYGVFTEEECRQAAVSRANQEFFWAICLKGREPVKGNGSAGSVGATGVATDKLIGNIYFQQQNPPEFMCWSLGYVLNPRYQGKGYATESCQAILEHGFTKMHVRRVAAMCNPENTPSWHLLERLGLRREGHFIKHKFFKRDAQGNPIWTDTLLYAMLAEEWRNTTFVRGA